MIKHNLEIVEQSMVRARRSAYQVKLQKLYRAGDPRIKRFVAVVPVNGGTFQMRIRFAFVSRQSAGQRAFLTKLGCWTAVTVICAAYRHFKDPHEASFWFSKKLLASSGSVRYHFVRCFYDGPGGQFLSERPYCQILFLKANKAMLRSCVAEWTGVGPLDGM